MPSLGTRTYSGKQIGRKGKRDRSCDFPSFDTVIAIAEDLEIDIPLAGKLVAEFLDDAVKHEYVPRSYATHIDQETVRKPLEQMLSV